MVEYLVANEVVVGSNPISRSDGLAESTIQDEPGSGENRAGTDPTVLATSPARIVSVSFLF